MILQALNSYYERLQNDPDTDVAPLGFSRQKIAYCVVINEDGSLNSIEDLRTQNEKKLVPKSVIVCGGAKPSGSGINPCFLWDNPAYMLGYKPDDPKPERTQESFEAFRKIHLDLESTIDDPEYSEVCRFLEKWEPSKAAEQQTLIDIGTGFGVFRISGAKHFVHERTTIQEWWRQHREQQNQESSASIGQCLVTGINGSIARLHEPKIKGVFGGQSSGAAIVSFNLDAFESYGKEQSINAPVSEVAAFQYCTALNRLLSDTSHRVLIGDTTTVFWTEEPTPAENILGFIFGNRPSEDQAEINRIQKTLELISKGSYPGDFGDAKTKFYVLGLSPNAARVSVRYWSVSTLGDLIDNLKHHFQDLQIIHGDRDSDFIYPWQILRETVRDAKDIPPLLGGSLMRSILTGQPYPQLLLASLIRRIRSDQTIRYVRAAAIKACLNRNHLRPDTKGKEISMSLDPDRADPAYCLGRLFAELEKTQEDALPGINDTIRSRFFGAASATPGSVFPRLIRMSQHHLGKMEKGKRTYHEKRTQEICSKIEKFPQHMNLRDQGLFAIGYYHQRQDFFTKITTDTDNTNNEE